MRSSWNAVPRPRRGRPAVIALALAVALAGCSRGEEGRYATEQVQVGDVAERVSAPGSVQPAAQAEVRAPSDARIGRLAVRNGQRVEEGQLVARLDSDQVNDSLRQAEAAVAAASSASLGGALPALGGQQALVGIDALQAEVGAAGEAVLAALRDLPPNLPAPERAAFERRLAEAERRLAESRRRAREAAAAAQAQAQAQGAALRQALDAMSAAQQAQAQAALAVARDAQQRLTLRAPIGGTVQLGRAGDGGAGAPAPSIPGLPSGAGQALQGLTGGGGGGAPSGPPLATGAEVGAGQTVASIVDVDELHVAAEVDETDIALVKAGQAADVELDAFPGTRFDAKVERIAATPTGTAQAPGAGGVSYQVDLLLGGPQPGTGEEAAEVEPVPRVGMTATADILVRESKGALTVASSALVGRGTGQGVLVVDDGVVRLRPVRLAASGEDRVAIADGLRAGDVVVTRGAERLRDGQDYPGS